MKTKPFNLEAALRGEPVVTRDGRLITSILDSECMSPYPLKSNDPAFNLKYWSRRGDEFANRMSINDLFMLDTSVSVDSRRGEYALEILKQLIVSTTVKNCTDGESRVGAAVALADELIRQLDA